MNKPTNDGRADRALNALAHYCGAGKGMLDESNVTDLLTDIWHLCARENIDVYLCWATAQQHYKVEIKE